MRTFSGFPAGPTRFTPVPDLFFTALLPEIDDLAELQLTLYLFWSLNRQKGSPRYLTVRELEGEGLLLSALAASRPDADAAALLQMLHEALERALERGTLLRVSISSPAESDGEPHVEHYIFVNTPQGRQAVADVKDGTLVLERPGVVQEPHVAQPRANIYELYERNIGVLPPLLAEELLEAEQTYAPDWIEDAFRIAVEHNARRWRYIRSILERWARDGKDDGRSSAPRTRPSARRSPRS